jgi:hypothetical protein
MRQRLSIESRQSCPNSIRSGSRTSSRPQEFTWKCPSREEIEQDHPVIAGKSSSIDGPMTVIFSESNRIAGNRTYPFPIGRAAQSGGHELLFSQSFEPQSEGEGFTSPAYSSSTSGPNRGSLS